jgi:hypothetical protein
MPEIISVGKISFENCRIRTADGWQVFGKENRSKIDE